MCECGYFEPKPKKSERKIVPPKKNESWQEYYWKLKERWKHTDKRKRITSMKFF